MRLILILFSLFVVLVPTTAGAAGGSVTAKTYKELTAIQEIMGEGKSDEAFARLETLLDEVNEDTLDQALVLQTLGYVEMSRENFPRAIKHLKASLALDKLPQNVVYNIGYMVAQLHAALDEFDQALEFAAGWFKSLEAPKPEQLIFMANIYAQTQRYAESVTFAERAIAASESPKETWYQLLTANYFELQRHREAAVTLQRTLEHWPENPTYWEQLASVYMVQENESAALAVLKIAFSQSILEKESTVKTLVQLAVMRKIPEHAARLLEAAFAADLLPENANTLEMLAVALAEAKERDRAIAAYRRMATVAENGDAWIAISKLYVEQGAWQKAEQALDEALKKELDSPGKAWILQGIAQAEQKKFDSARASFRKASAFSDTERSASRWLRYNEDMKRQADWIAQNQ